MKITFKFAHAAAEIDIPDANLLADLHPAKEGAPAGTGGTAAPARQGGAAVPGGEAARGEAAIVEAALKNPIGTPRLGDIVRRGETVAVVTSDITRPMPSYKVLPAVVAELRRGGIGEKDITVVLGLGSHRPHTDAERAKLAGPEVAERVRVIDSDSDDTVLLGSTKRGTPVRVDRTVAGADRRVLLGNIEYHYFAGYSGGMKAIMPGVSTREAIRHNHGFMLEPGAEAGRIDGNPVREDIDEVLSFCPADFIVNVVLSEDKKITAAFAGHPLEAHRAGCRALDLIYKTPIPERADIVVVSAGGFPKDINLYQAQKALDNAKYAVKDGGILIFHAACTEGYGEKMFEEWIKTKLPEDMLREIRENFRLGAHKAAAIAQVMGRAEIFFVSALPGGDIPPGMTSFADIPSALAEAFRRKGKNAMVIAMPMGGSTLPVPA
jgi:nickel-dependent lactate racemase